MLNYHQICEKFSKVFNGQFNYMTPLIDDYGQHGRFIYEVSYDRAIAANDRIYGVTIISLPDTKRQDLSTAFSSRKEAYIYINKLTNNT